MGRDALLRPRVLPRIGASDKNKGAADTPAFAYPHKAAAVQTIILADLQTFIIVIIGLARIDFRNSGLR
jgi:hypothetical protein